MTNIHAEVVASKKWMLKRGGWRGRPGGGETTAPLEVREYRRQPRGSVASVGSRPATAPSEPRTSPSRGRPGAVHNFVQNCTKLCNFKNP